MSTAPALPTASDTPYCAAMETTPASASASTLTTPPKKWPSLFRSSTPTGPATLGSTPGSHGASSDEGPLDAAAQRDRGPPRTARRSRARSNNALSKADGGANCTPPNSLEELFRVALRVLVASGQRQRRALSSADANTSSGARAAASAATACCAMCSAQSGAEPTPSTTTTAIGMSGTVADAIDAGSG